MKLSADQIRIALERWMHTPGLPERHLALIAELYESILISEERFKQMARFLWEHPVHSPYLHEAVALARFHGILKNTDELNAASP